MVLQLEQLVKDIRRCKICVTAPLNEPLPHDPRPVLQVSSTARLAICGQAPGTKVHLSGRPFTDRSGDRLREWLGLSCEVFYDASKVAVVPMGFCFPGQTAQGADLPPRKECVAAWHDQLMPLLQEVRLVLVVGRYAMAYHMNIPASRTLADVVSSYESYFASQALPRLLPLPHPSWRNTHWLKKNPWFEAAYVPRLRQAVADVLAL